MKIEKEIAKAEEERKDRLAMLKNDIKAHNQDVKDVIKMLLEEVQFMKYQDIDNNTYHVTRIHD